MEENGVSVQERPGGADTLEADRARALEEKQARKEAAAKAKKRKIRRKRIVTLVVVLLVVGGIAFGMYSLFHEKEPEKTIWSDVVYRGSIQSTVTGSGTTKALNSATLTLTSGGEVREVFVTAGQQVTQGDALYTVDSTEAEKAVEDAKKTVEDYQKQIDALNKSYADLTFTAPFSGKLIDAPSLKVGDEIGSGTKLGTLVDDKTMKLSLYFSYAYENAFSVGKTATISIPSTMQTVTGTVSAINKVRRVAQEGSTLFEVVFSLPNAGTLTADMGATAFLTGAGGEEIYPYEAGKLEYNRSQELTTKAGGELMTANLLNYADVSAGQVLVQMKGDDNDDQMAALNTSMTTARENLTKAEKALNNYHASAPISGTVISCSLVPGETAEAGRVAVTIADTSVMLVDIQIDSLNITYVQPGMACDLIMWGSEGQIPFFGTVDTVSMEGKNENGVSYFPATVKVDNPDGTMKPGMPVDYSMIASQSDDCLLVPNQAVKQSAEGTCVFIKAETAPDNAMDPENLGLEVPEGFFAVPVTVGLSDQANAEIVDGVEEGQEVFIQYMTNEANSWQSGGVMIG